MNDPLGLFDEEKTQGQSDPLGLFEETPKKKTTVGEDLMLGVANLQNTMERAAQLITAPGLAAYSKLRGVEPEETFRLLKEGRDARLRKAVGDKEQSFGGKMLSVLSAIPAFPLLLAGSPLDTAAQFLEEGESVPRALTAGGIDLAGNMLGMKFDPVGGSIRKRLLANTAIQAGQDTATRAAIEQVAENKSTKDIFAPSMETAAMAGMLGGGMSLLYKGKQVGDLTPEQRMREAAARRKAAKTEAPTEKVPEQLDLFDLNADPTQGMPNKFNAGQGYENWRLDENGMPIRADLSMEAQNLQNPLQMNLWGDELGPAQGQMRSLTEAIDTMPPGPQRELGLEQLGNKAGAVEADAENLVAKMEADGPQVQPLNRGMGRRERGAIDLSSFISDERKKFVEDLLKTRLLPEKVNGEDVVAAALQEGKDARGLSYVESGGSMTAIKRNSAAILGASRLVQQAANEADLNVRENVMPVERSLRKLSRPDLSALMNIFKEETALEKKFTPQELAEFGYKPEVLAAYNDMRTMFSKALAAENAAREALGKKPVTELEFYTSHRWNGNFRQDFMDTDGKHVWSLAGKTKWDLARQRKALLKQFPDLQPSKERIVRQGKDVASPVELYKHMLDVLGEDDPAVARIKEWFEKQAVEDPAKDMLAQEKHFKRRAGVRGYVGDRPVNEPAGLFNRGEGEYNPHKEAMDFFQEQITYAKNGFRWSEMQKAGQEIKKIISDPALNEQQPNNVRYIRDYWKQNLGVSEAKFISQMEDYAHDFGISPREMRKVVGDVKSAWIGQKLLASAGFVASNILQMSAVLPHMADIMAKTGGNPLRGLAAGMIGFMNLPVFHYAAFLPEGSVNTARKNAMSMMDPFMAKAMRYAEDNGVVSRSTYDESPIEASFSVPRRVAELTAKATISAPETFIRSFAFMAYAEQLRSSGKYADDMEIFRLAEERTNASMVDMRAGERPILFNKLGMFGDLAGALQSFPINFYNQWNWALRESVKGNVLPALTMALVQYNIAGFMGLPGFQDMDKLMEMIKKWAAENDPKLWAQIKDANPKRLVMDNLGEDALYGKLSADSGVALTTRVAAPSFSDMATSGANIVSDIGKQAGNILSFAHSPSEKKFAKAAIESAPVGLQGLLETTAFRDVLSKPVEGGRLYEKRDKNEGSYIRTPEEENIRKLGVRSQREAVTKDEDWQRRSRELQAERAATSALDKFYDNATRGNEEEAKSYASLYMQLTGREIDAKLLENRLIKEYTSADQRGQMTPKRNLEAIKAMKRMEDIVNNLKSP